MASIFRRSKKYAQSEAAQQCLSEDISTEDYEDYVLVTVDERTPEQPVNKHRVYSLESSLDSGYEEIHMPPPASEEDTAVGGAGSICSQEAKQVSAIDAAAELLPVVVRLTSR